MLERERRTNTRGMNSFLDGERTLEDSRRPWRAVLGGGGGGGNGTRVSRVGTLAKEAGGRKRIRGSTNSGLAFEMSQKGWELSE